MASSTFQNIRAALASAVTTRLASDGVTGVDVFQYPPMGQVTREHKVWFGRISVDQEPLTMGANRALAETLDIEFVVWAPVRGSDQQDAAVAETRAETILASVEAAIRADSDVGSTVMFAQVDSFESVMDYDEQGAAAVITGSIQAEANL